MERFSEGSAVLNNSQEHEGLVEQLMQSQADNYRRQTIRFSALANLAAQGAVATPDTLRDEIARQTAELPVITVATE